LTRDVGNAAGPSVAGNTQAPFTFPTTTGVSDDRSWLTGLAQQASFWAASVEPAVNKRDVSARAIKALVNILVSGPWCWRPLY
jgi:hypothetical protein